MVLHASTSSCFISANPISSVHAQASKPTHSPPKRVKAKMLRTLRMDSDYDEQQARERAYFVRVQTEPSQDNNTIAKTAALYIQRVCTGKIETINNSVIDSQAERDKVNTTVGSQDRFLYQCPLLYRV